MTDKDRIKLKAQDILRKELPSEEFLLVSLQVKESDKDKQLVEINKAVALELAKIMRAEQLVKEQEDLDKLAVLVGLPMLPSNSFTLSVSKFYQDRGGITEGQKKSLLSNYS